MPMDSPVKNRIAEIINPHIKTDSLSRGFNFFIITLIFLNVVAVALETVQNLSSNLPHFFRAFEVFSVGIFTIEYFLRVWIADLDERYRRPITGRLRYMVSPMALIDLMAVTPFYLPMIIDFDLRFLRVLRLFRMFALLKMMRYSKSLNLIGKVINEKKEELLIVFAGTMALLVMASGIIYFLENEAQPEAFSSIPAAMWWGVSTMTTVGYGDIYPITPLGKLFGGVISILGLGTFGLPAGIISYGFIEEIQKRRFQPTSCPHCGKNITVEVERRAPR